MSVGQKAALSLLISTILAAVFSVFAFTELFQLIETRFFDQKVKHNIESSMDAILSSNNAWHEENISRFGEIVNKDYLRRAFLPEQTEEDDFSRRQAVGKLTELNFGFSGLRVVDTDGKRIHYSSIVSDLMRSTELTLMYRNYGEEGDEPYSNLIANEGDSARVINLPKKREFAYSFPFVDSFGEYRGTVLFYVSYNGLKEQLTKNGNMSIGDEILSVGNKALLIAAPSWLGSDFVSQLDSLWENGANSEPLTVGQTDSSDSFVVFARESSSYIIAKIVPASWFGMPEVLNWLILAAVFISTYLLLFLLLNLKQDRFAILATRIKRFQIELLTEYLERKGEIDINRWASEIEIRRSETRERIKKSAGRLGKKRAKDIDELVDKSWDEIISIMTGRDKKSFDIERLENMIKEVLSKTPIVVNNAVVKSAVAENIVPAKASTGQKAIASEEIEELEEAEALEELEEAEAVAELEEAEAVEEVEELEEAEAVEELEEVAELEEAEAVEEAEPIEELEELEEAEPVEELSEAVEEAEAVEELDEDSQELMAVSDISTEAVEELDEAENDDLAQAMEEMEIADAFDEFARNEASNNFASSAEHTEDLQEANQGVDSADTADTIEEIEEAEFVEELEEVEALEEIEEAEETRLEELENANVIESSQEEASQNEAEDVIEEYSISALGSVSADVEDSSDDVASSLVLESPNFDEEQNEEQDSSLDTEEEEPIKFSFLSPLDNASFDEEEFSNGLAFDEDLDKNENSGFEAKTKGAKTKKSASSQKAKTQIKTASSQKAKTQIKTASNALQSEKADKIEIVSAKECKELRNILPEAESVIDIEPLMSSYRPSFRINNSLYRRTDARVLENLEIAEDEESQEDVIVMVDGVFTINSKALTGDVQLDEDFKKLADSVLSNK